MKPSATYFHQTIFPVHFGVLFCEKDYEKEMKRLGIKVPGNFIIPGTRAAAKWVEDRDGKASDVLLICIDLQKAKKELHKNVLTALMAHEVSHIVDNLFISIGETKPGAETKAYLTQWVLQNTLDAMDKWKPSK